MYRLTARGSRQVLTGQMTGKMLLQRLNVTSAELGISFITSQQKTFSDQPHIQIGGNNNAAVACVLAVC